MGHMSVYLITLAEDAEDAKSEARIWLDEYANREFFDYGNLEEPEKVVLVSEIRDELVKEKQRTLLLLPGIESNIARWKVYDDRSMEGYEHIRYGQILCESVCCDMPFFNITNWDWSIPTEVPQEDAWSVKITGKEWWAVRVDLHC